MNAHYLPCLLPQAPSAWPLGPAGDTTTYRLTILPRYTYANTLQENALLPLRILCAPAIIPHAAPNFLNSIPADTACRAYRFVIREWRAVNDMTDEDRGGGQDRHATEGEWMLTDVLKTPVVVTGRPAGRTLSGMAFSQAGRNSLACQPLF